MVTSNNMVRFLDGVMYNALLSRKKARTVKSIATWTYGPKIAHSIQAIGISREASLHLVITF